MTQTLRVYAVLSEEDGTWLSTLSFSKAEGEQSVLKLTGDSAMMMRRIRLFEAHCHGDLANTQEMNHNSHYD